MFPRFVRRAGPEIALGVFAALPLLVGFLWIRQLFWFGDDFAFMADLDAQGFQSWVQQIFGENYIPLFKTLWAAVFLGGHGSSAFALTCNGLTHLLNVLLFYRLLLRSDFGRFSAFCASGAFAVAAANVEILTWSMGWSTMLAGTFLLCTLLSEADPSPGNWQRSVRTFAFVTASALTHARGVVAGPAAATMALTRKTSNHSSVQRGIRAGLMLLPCVGAAIAIVCLAPKNHHEVFINARLAARAVTFAAWYFAANPFVALFTCNTTNWTYTPLTDTALVTLGVAKATVYGLALLGGTGQQKRLLWGLLVAELGTAALLGLGRSYDDPTLAMSSRYQYASLFSNLPFVFAAARFIAGKIKMPRRFSLAAGGLVLAICVVQNARLWTRLLPPWCAWRGVGTRAALHSTENPNGHDIPGAGFINNREARRLAEKYQLH